MLRLAPACGALRRVPSCTFLLAFCSFLFCSGVQRAHAQDAAGYEVALDGMMNATPGQPFVVGGVLYRIDGIAELRAVSSRGVVARARYESKVEGIASGSWVDLAAGADGVFTLQVPIPSRAEGESVVVFELGERRIEQSIRLQPAVLVEFRTDRSFYEPGETAHLWALVRESGTRRLLAGRQVRFRLEGERVREALGRTDASGVAHAEFPFAAEQMAESFLAVSRVAGAANQSVRIGVGERTTENLLVDVEVPDEVAPGARFEARVSARTASGSSISGAHVELSIRDMEDVVGTTGADGVAVLEVSAPAFLSNRAGRVSMTVKLNHPGHGEAVEYTSTRLAVPHLLQVRAVPAHNGLMVDRASRIYVSVLDVTGAPPDEPTQVVLRGPGIPGRSPLSGTTDAHGLVEFDVTVGDADPARFRSAGGGSCQGRRAVSYDVTLVSTYEVVSRVCVPVHEAVAVRPSVRDAVRAPGESLEIALTRTREAASLPAWVALLGENDRVLAAQMTRARSVQFTTPDVLGVVRVLARPVWDESQSETALGEGVSDSFIVRPANPSFPTAEPTADVYDIGALAGVRVHASGGGWIAVDVRDLAQHGGEAPFAVRFLRGHFRRALLDPNTPELDRLVRVTLVERLDEQNWRPRESAPLVSPRSLQVQHRPGVGLLRDPVRMARETVRRSLGAAFIYLEQAVERGGEVHEGDGARRRFAANALQEAEFPTLDGRRATVRQLETADPSFSFDAVARRITRQRLWRVLQAIVRSTTGRRDGSFSFGASDPPERWISELVRLGHLSATAVRDPWGGAVGWRARPAGVLPISARTLDRVPAFPGPDGRLGTADDIVDPLARIVPEGTPYAVAIGEDALMERIAQLATGSAALALMIEELTRLTAAMHEARTGDVASASSTIGIGDSFGVGGLGLRGVGAGGGGGAGYGRGAGGMRGRSSRVPRIRAASASVMASGGILGLVREEFPGTLLFEPSIPVHASGTTEVPIQLADAATTYLVEVVQWRADGWSWTTSTRIRSEQPLLVSAPVPAYATEGDRLQIPVRAMNTTATPFDVQVSLQTEELSPDQQGQADLSLPAAEARAALVELSPSQGSGSVMIRGAGGGHADAVRLPIVVNADGRVLDLRESGLLQTGEQLDFEVPEGARDLGEVRIELTAGRAILGEVSERWTGWLSALEGTPASEQAVAAAFASLPSGSQDDVAVALAVLWSESSLSDRRARELLEVASDTGERLGLSPMDRAKRLLLLAPVLRRPDARPDLADTVRALARAMRDTVGQHAVSQVRAPNLHAISAAALLGADPSARRRAQELLRRARRSRVTFDNDVWLQGGQGGVGALVASAAYGLASAWLGDSQEAYAILSTFRRRAVERPVFFHRIEPRDIGWMHALASVLGGDEVSEVELSIDGEAQRVPLENGVAEIERAAFEPGVHRIVVNEAHAHVVVRERVRVPWQASIAGQSPIVLSVEGDDPGDLGRHEFVLEVRNARPGLIRDVSVSITLPAGAVLDQLALRDLRSRVRHLNRDAGRLSFELPTLFPRRTVRLPLVLRFEVGGELRALGVVAFPEDRPDRETVLPPRVLNVGVEASQ